MGVALGALAVAFGPCEAPASNDAKLHLAAAPEDFKALGIGKEIEVREDGRRTPKSSDYFEWWYFDGLFGDGTVFVVWFGDNWLYGSHKRALNIDLTPPGKPTRHIVRTFDDPPSNALRGPGPMVMDGSNSTVANAADRGQIYQLLRAFGRFSRCIRNVRSGSEADIARGLIYVRFTPESGHWQARLRCLLRVKSGRVIRSPRPRL